MRCVPIKGRGRLYGGGGLICILHRDNYNKYLGKNYLEPLCNQECFDSKEVINV